MIHFFGPKYLYQNSSVLNILLEPQHFGKENDQVGHFTIKYFDSSRKIRKTFPWNSSVAFLVWFQPKMFSDPTQQKSLENGVWLWHWLNLFNFDTWLATKGYIFLWGKSFYGTPGIHFATLVNWNLFYNFCFSVKCLNLSLSSKRQIIGL